jgi:hypothetical protein
LGWWSGSSSNSACLASMRLCQKKKKNPEGFQDGG